jgi:peptide/nickel transport system permease protein
MPDHEAKPKNTNIITPPDLIEKKLAAQSRWKTLFWIQRNPGVVIGGLTFMVLAVVAVFAGSLTTVDPMQLDADRIFTAPGADYWFGGDAMGRSIWSRTVFGSRISLMVGFSVVILATSGGLFIGLISGYFRLADAVIMRIMDGLMAIPGILLAIALMTLSEPSVRNVVIAITIPNLPRVVRLIRAMVLSIREQPFVEAAIAAGTGTGRIIFRHILPITLAPLAVQATYIFAAAIINEAYLSFLGAGTPPEISSWGNIMSEGRAYFSLAPWLILIPGTSIAITVLAMNVLGDGLRDMLDPRVARKL